jgi:hypothetical protein
MEPHGIIVPTASPVVAGIKLINQISINVVLAKIKRTLEVRTKATIHPTW